MEGPDAARKAVGTGPFTFVEWVQGDHLQFAKNAHYWQSNKPYLDALHVTINADPQTMITQFEAGALDAANLPPVRDAVRLAKDPKFRLMVNQRTGGYYLAALNTALPPLDNKLVRQALNHAIDRQRFVDSVLLGTSEAESLPWPSFAPAYEAAKKSGITFDLDKAKSLLAQAGVSGFEMDLVFSTVGAATEYTALGQIYQADLAKIGVKMNLKPLEAAVWRDQVGNHKFNGINLDSSRFANLESVSVFSTSVYWLPQGNAENYNNERYKQLVEAAATEPDAAKRKQVYSQLNDFLLDESFVMVLATNPPSVLVRDGLNDLRYSGHDGLLYTDAWLAG